jgi:hypothetical protein
VLRLVVCRCLMFIKMGKMDLGHARIWCGDIASMSKRRELVRNVDEAVAGVARHIEGQSRSRTPFSRVRSFRFARRIAIAMNGAATFEKPEGVPRLRSVIRVAASSTDSHV